VEVKPGFKLTEVGVIPEEWEVKVVGDAFEIRNQLRLPISQSVRESMSGPFPYYGPTSVQGWINEYRVEGEHALIGEDGDHFLKWRDQTMTLLVSGKFNVNNHAHIVRGTKNLTAWFYWFFASRDISNHLTRQGAGRYKLTKATLLKLPCALPSHPEQRAIAAALSDVDALLGGLDRLISKKRDLKQAAAQRLLTGQTRLPGFRREWEVKRIAEIAMPASEKNASGESLPVLTCSKHFGFMDSLGFFRNQVFSKDLSTYKVIRRDEIGYPANHVEEGSIGLQDLYDVALVSPIYVVFKVCEDVSSFFLHRLLKLDSYRQRFKTATTSSIDRRGSLRWPAFSEITVGLPSTKAEQTAVAAVLSDMEAEVAALEARREKTRALRQAMMQELLTGKTRLVRTGGAYA
jgi:type I restriction enzyme S subunit